MQLHVNPHELILIGENSFLRLSTDGGQSHSCERPTCNSPAPSACKSSVELAMSETTRGWGEAVFVMTM